MKRLQAAMLALLVLLLTLMLAPAAAMQDSGPRVEILSVDSSAFPQLTLSVRVRNAQGIAVGGLDASSFTITEGDSAITDLSVGLSDELPIALGVVIDLGRYANYPALGEDRVREALSYGFDNGLFREGSDSVFVLARLHENTEETRVLLETTGSSADYLNWLAGQSLRPTFGQSQAMVAVDEAIARLQQVEGPTVPVILLISPFIDGLTVADAEAYAQQTAQAAADSDIAIYTLHTHLRGELPGPLQTLSRVSGGQYLQLAGASPDLASFYAAMGAQRSLYTLTYQSPSFESGEREIVLAVNTPEGTGAAIGNYSVQIDPPAVAISSPAPGEAILIDPDGEEGPASLIVTAAISWTGAPRAISSASLLVNDVTYEGTPQGDSLRFEIPLEEIETGDYSFAVQVVDEFGLSARSETVNASIEIARSGLIAGCLADPLQVSCLALACVPPLLLLVLLGAGVAIFLASRRGRKPKPASAPRPATVPERTAEVMPIGTAELPQAKRSAPGPNPALETVVAGFNEGSDQPASPGRAVDFLYRLHILQGDRRGEVITVREETISLGRNPEKVTQVFYPDIRSSVSGEHAALRVFRNRLYLTDLRSRNGTKLNGAPLEGGQPREVPDGAEIILGDLLVAGVRMRVELGSVSGPAPDAPSSHSAATIVEGGPSGEATVIETDAPPPPPAPTPSADATMIESGDAPPPPPKKRTKKSSDKKDDDWMEDLG